jgi:hypothetical protein
MVRRSGIPIMLSQFSAKGVERSNHLAVAEADALFGEFQSKGVKIPREICDQAGGCGDFDVEDCSGYRLCFGHDTEG